MRLRTAIDIAALGTFRVVTDSLGVALARIEPCHFNKTTLTNVELGLSVLLKVVINRLKRKEEHGSLRLQRLVSTESIGNAQCSTHASGGPGFLLRCRIFLMLVEVFPLDKGNTKLGRLLGEIVKGSRHTLLFQPESLVLKEKTAGRILPSFPKPFAFPQ
jgi:hypothetical protein